MTEKRILIIEDDVGIQAITKFSLEMDTNWRVMSAFDGREGLFKAKNLHPDVILLDIVMPNVNGYEILEKLQNDRATNKIPIILFTAKDINKIALELYNLPITGIITKPFDCLDLSAKIAQLLDWQYQYRP